MDLEKLIAELKARGLRDEEVLAELVKLKDEGKLTEEELEHAKGLLHANEDIGEDEEKQEEKEREEAEKYFGLKFI